MSKDIYLKEALKQQMEKELSPDFSVSVMQAIKRREASRQKRALLLEYISGISVALIFLVGVFYVINRYFYLEMIVFLNTFKKVSLSISSISIPVDTEQWSLAGPIVILIFSIFIILLLVDQFILKKYFHKY